MRVVPVFVSVRSLHKFCRCMLQTLVKASKGAITFYMKSVLPFVPFAPFAPFLGTSARHHLSSGQEVTRGRCHPCRFCPVRCHEGHARVLAAQAANSWSWALPPRRSATWSRVAAGHLHDLASQRLASTQERVGSSTASGDVDRTPPCARISAASQRISALWRDSCVLVGAGRAVGCRRRAGGVGGAQEGPLDEI